MCYYVSRNVVLKWWLLMWKPMKENASLSWYHIRPSSCPRCTCCRAPVKQFLAPIRSPFFQYCSPNVFQPSTRPGSSFTARARHSSAAALKSGATFRHLPFCSRNSALCLKWSAGSRKHRHTVGVTDVMQIKGWSAVMWMQHSPSFSSSFFKVFSISFATSLCFLPASSTPWVSK